MSEPNSGSSYPNQGDRKSTSGKPGPAKPATKNKRRAVR